MAPAASRPGSSQPASSPTSDRCVQRGTTCGSRPALAVAGPPHPRRCRRARRLCRAPRPMPPRSPPPPCSWCARPRGRSHLGPAQQAAATAPRGGRTAARLLPGGPDPAVDVCSRRAAKSSAPRPRTAPRSPRARTPPAGRRASRRSTGARAVLEPSQNLGQPVLDRLVGADRAPEREALLGVGDATPRAPSRRRRSTRPRSAPGRGTTRARAPPRRRRAGRPRAPSKGHVPEPAGRVVARGPPRPTRPAVGVDRTATGSPSAPPRPDQQRGARGVGDEGEPSRDAGGVASIVTLGASRPGEAGAARPARRPVVRRGAAAGQWPGAGGRARPPRATRALFGVEDRGGGQVPEQRQRARARGRTRRATRSASKASSPAPPCSSDSRPGQPASNEVGHRSGRAAGSTRARRGRPRSC